MSVKVKVNGSCTLFVLGMDMNCPLCGVLVKSGQQHACERKEIEAPKKKKRLVAPLREGR